LSGSAPDRREGGSRSVRGSTSRNTRGAMPSVYRDHHRQGSAGPNDARSSIEKPPHFPQCCEMCRNSTPLAPGPCAGTPSALLACGALPPRSASVPWLVGGPLRRGPPCLPKPDPQEDAAETGSRVLRQSWSNIKICNLSNRRSFFIDFWGRAYRPGGIRGRIAPVESAGICRPDRSRFLSRFSQPRGPA
jgi:hypothetical protein